MLKIWVFPKIGVPQNGWFIMENPIKMGWFGGTNIFGNIHMGIPTCYFLFRHDRDPRRFVKIFCHRCLLSLRWRCLPTSRWTPKLFGPWKMLNWWRVCWCKALQIARIRANRGFGDLGKYLLTVVALRKWMAVAFTLFGSDNFPERKVGHRSTTSPSWSIFETDTCNTTSWLKHIEVALSKNMWVAITFW